MPTRPPGPPNPQCWVPLVQGSRGPGCLAGLRLLGPSLWRGVKPGGGLPSSSRPTPGKCLLWGKQTQDAPGSIPERRGYKEEEELS